METKLWITKNPETGALGSVLSNFKPLNAVAEAPKDGKVFPRFEDLSITEKDGKFTVKVDAKKKADRIAADEQKKTDEAERFKRMADAELRLVSVDFEKISTVDELKGALLDFLIARGLK